MRENGPVETLSILIDQGTEDQFLKEQQLLPEAFEVREYCAFIERVDGVQASGTKVHAPHAGNDLILFVT